MRISDWSSDVCSSDLVARVSELRRRPREVEMQRPVADRQKQPDRGEVSLLIAGQKILRRERPARDRADGGLEPPFGKVEKRADAFAEALNPVSVEKRRQTFDAHDIGRELRLKVSAALVRRTRIQQDDVEDVLIDLIVLHDTDARKTKKSEERS